MRPALLALALMLAACGRAPVDTSADVASIETQMHQRFDRPDSRLEAGPVVVRGDHAIADWTQGPMGGRALFRRHNGAWSLVLCSGDGLRDQGYLTRARVPAADAEALVRLLADAERSVAPDRLAKMRAFSGTVTAEQMPS
ncbi:MAG TPA: copper uptake system-associated protein [Allosphingosinicella sp.]|nr:copper uptake system-associated protein [Allosphingosinicella sp.]